MMISETQIRVRYGETDQMGFVYYGNYALYFEVGRAEAMRKLGMSYRQMEEKGVYMPIAQLNVKYLKPARYDDLLTVRTIVREMPASRMTFDYEVYNTDKTLLCTGSTVLAFVKTQTNRPCPAPDWLIEKLNTLMNQKP
ncbi:MAG TPA: thioesterase family protein [Bacteroidales bacterium]|nr:thioesterase family protein [Bacteroidales bacterium]